jgi:hypothetical protein
VAATKTSAIVADRRKRDVSTGGCRGGGWEQS